MKSIHFFTKMLLAAALLFAISCQKDEVEEKTIETDISGVAQKGPFNVGTAVTLSELSETFSQTGKTFAAQINSDDGSFGLKGIVLSSPFVEMKADGFYFDEIKGENSAAKLTLTAIADIGGKSTVNVNVLSHLEKPRTEYLLTKGYTFGEAKAKAQQEVLAMLNFQGQGIGASESLNIASAGEGDAALLAFSSILQGYRPVAEVSELLTNIANDLKEDGTLDNAQLQTALISHALYIDPAKVKQNLAGKYSALGATAQIPEFGQHVQQFIAKTAFVPAGLINFPAQSPKGLNILNAGNESFESGLETAYSMAAETVEGLGLKIELEVAEGTPTGAGWGYSADQVNWRISDYDRVGHKQTFEIIDTGKPAELRILFMRGGIKVQIRYIEGTRERTRVVTVV